MKHTDCPRYKRCSAVIVFWDKNISAREGAGLGFISILAIRDSSIPHY